MTPPVCFSRGHSINSERCAHAGYGGLVPYLPPSADLPLQHPLVLW